MGYPTTIPGLRRLHGDAEAHQLGVRRSWASALLPGVALDNQVQRAWERNSPAARQCALHRSTASFRT